MTWFVNKNLLKKLAWIIHQVLAIMIIARETVEMKFYNMTTFNCICNSTSCLNKAYSIHHISNEIMKSLATFLNCNHLPFCFILNTVRQNTLKHFVSWPHLLNARKIPGILYLYVDTLKSTLVWTWCRASCYHQEVQ